jgi:hypothetical protein
MSKSLSQMAEELTDSMTASVSAPRSWSDGTYSLNNVSDTITITGGGYTYANTGGGYTGVTGSLGPYTLSAGTNTQPWYSNSGSGKIRLDGEGADIEVNGESLMTMLHRIEERLNILTPNTKLEEEWGELQALGDQYRALEKQIKEKQATWDRLKAMPPPVID